MRDEEGVWRIYTWGAGFVVKNAPTNLMSIPAAQRFGLGAEYKPYGGANMIDASGRRLPMTMGGNKTQQVEMCVMSSKDPRPDGCAIDESELREKKKLLVGAAYESTQQGMVDVACGWKKPVKPWKGPDGRRAETRKQRKNRMRWLKKRMQKHYEMKRGQLLTQQSQQSELAAGVEEEEERAGVEEEEERAEKVSHMRARQLVKLLKRMQNGRKAETRKQKQDPLRWLKKRIQVYHEMKREQLRAQQSQQSELAAGVEEEEEEERAEKVRFMRERHLIEGHPSATVMNERFERGEYRDENGVERGCRISGKDLGTCPDGDGCPSCPWAKMTRGAQSKVHERTVASMPLHTFQMDLYDPRLRVRNRSGFKYIMGFICLATGWRFVVFLKSKSAEDCLRGIKALEDRVALMAPDVMKKFGGEAPRVVKLCVDTEPGVTTTWGYTESIVDEYCRKQRIQREFTRGHGEGTKNGRIERSWRTLDTMASSQLAEAGMNEEWYMDSFACAVREVNYTSSRVNRLERGEAPAKTLGLRDYARTRADLRVFGAPAWRFVGHDAKKRQMGARCLFIGYGRSERGGGCYRVVDLESRKILTDVHVKVRCGLAPVRNFLTSMREDPFFAGKQGDWVWRLFDKEPRARVARGQSLFRGDDGESVKADVLGPDGSPVVEREQQQRPGCMKLYLTGDGGEKLPAPGEGQGDVGADRPPEAGGRDGDGERWISQEPNVPTTVGTSANDDSRADLLPRGEKQKKRDTGKKKVKWADLEKQKKCDTGKKKVKSDVMTWSEAKELIQEAREKDLVIRFVADKKGGLSGERYEKYKKFTSVAQCDQARKWKMTYSGDLKRTETVMKPLDLQNDVVKGICEILGADGEVLTQPEGARREAQLAMFRENLEAAVVSDVAFGAAVRQHVAMKGDLVEVPEWVAMAAKMKMMVQVDGMIEPVSIKQAMRLPEWESWKAAVEKEVRGLVEVGVWDEVPRSEVPAGRVVVPCHYVLKLKTVQDTVTGRMKVDKLKARLVYGGHRSVAGVDYHETAAYTASAKSVRTVCALGVRRGYKVVSWDLAQAFTFAEIEDGQELFMELPELLGQGGVSAPELYDGCGAGRSSGKVARLKRHLYGSKDAPRAWMQQVQKFMKWIGEEPGYSSRSLVSDRMAFRWETPDGEMNMCVHVDDIVATPSCEAVRAAFEQKLKQYFGAERVTGGTEPDYVLGMRVERDWKAKTLTLSQGGFVRQMLEDFGVPELEPGRRRVAESPLPLGLKLGAAEGRVVRSDEFDYLKFVGSLQWLVMCTRPDLAQVAGLLGRYSNAPGEEHVKACEHVLQYLAGTVDLGITYHGSDGVLMAGGYDRRDKLIASVDSDLGGCVETHKSTSGLVVFLNGGPISWKSKKQSTNSTATLEAEMKAAALVGMELVWLRDLVCELGVEQGCVRVMEDNAGCVALAHGQKDTAKSNHFKRTQAYVECLVGRGVMWLDDVPGMYNPADIFTKGPSSSLPVKRFGELRDVVMGRYPFLFESSGAAEYLKQGRQSANELLTQVRQWQED